MRGSTVIMCCLVCTLSVADSVRVLDSRGRETIRQGTIVDLKGSKLTLQNRAGRATTIGLDRVQSIESDWTAQQLKGDEAFAAGKFASALESYRAAFATEKRSWAKRQLLSRVVWCYRNAGRPAEACQMFVRIVREDADTPYFAAIPLTWENRACPAEVKRIVATWRASDRLPTEQLLAASWMLVTDRGKSIATLRELARHTSPRIRRLATLQMWRGEILTLQRSRLEWWETQTKSAPTKLRAGAYFLLGQSYARFGRADDAITAFLRVPLQYPDDILLGQKSLLEAADLSEQHVETKQFLQQAVALGNTTNYGQRAAARLKELAP